MNIENKKQFATILLAVGLGLIAALLTSQYVQNKIEEQKEFLARDLQKKNTALVQQMDLMGKELKQVKQDQETIAKMQQQMRIDQAAQARQVQAGVQKPAVQMAAFSIRTPPGKRAVTISIESLAAVGGLVNPGDFVDIIAKLKIPKEDEDDPKAVNEVTTMLFQNIQVLAVGTNFKPLTNEPAYELQQKSKSLNVTLAVSPEEAGLLAFAGTNGTFTLALRAPVEEGNTRVQVASWDALSEFVKEQQDTDLAVPRPKATVESTEKFSPSGGISVEMEGPSIQIFRGGQEL
jgi:Flp pilus assembly protein CpaB